MLLKQHFPNFVSIKWKYLLTFSVILVIINFGLSLQSSHSLNKQFELHQSKNNHKNVQQLLGLLDNGYELLIQTAYTAQQSLITENLSIEDAEEISYEIIDTYELEALHFFSRDRQEPYYGLPLPHNYKKLLQDVFDFERAHSGIFCKAQCNIFSMVPVLQRDKSTAVFYLTKSVANLLENFYNVSGNDIALVDTRNRRIYASTNAKTILPFLRNAMELRKPSADYQELVWQGRNYELNYLQPRSRYAQFEFLIVSDITENLSTIQQSNRENMYYGFMGLLLSSVVLLLLLIKPISRVLHLSQHLPLLSSKQHDKFRKQFQMNKKANLFRDELDILESTSVNLANQLQASENSLIWQAEHDGLTGLKNRHRFRQDFEQVLNNSLRFGHEGALLYFDLDEFKYVNDSSGHKTGDMLLKLVADQVQNSIRSTDILARLGGDEFALILPETDEDGAVQLAQKIQNTLSEVTLPADDYLHRTSASIGVVMFPASGDNVEELVANGDIAMYQAKEDGRSNIHLFSHSDSSREAIHHRLRWKDMLEKALKENRLALFFQPILDLKTKTISHHEALLRLIEEDGNIVSPASFIAEAERSSLINSIDFYVLRQAFKHLSQDRNQSKLAINLSGKTINDEGLVTYISGLLETYKINPERVIFEVTETAAVSDIYVASGIMKQITSLGCKFALDDFGIGFSSFYYLKQLPVEYIKIDGAFIRNIVKNKDDQLFVKAITAVISGLGKKTVAEFVEDEQALKLLESYGVNYAQGYHIGKPIREPEHTYHNL